MTYGDATALGAPDPSRLNSPLAGIARSADGKGYWLVSAGGGVFTYGDATFFGTPGAGATYGPFVGLAPTTDDDGYWIARDDGIVFSFGDAAEFDLATFPSAPIVGIAAAPGTAGFWLVGTDGGVFTSNGASFYGSLAGKRLNDPIVGLASTPDGRGYWLVARDGGVFTFGDAQFFGSQGGQHLNQPVVGMTATPDGRGYWLVAADGGVFSFGDAVFYGSRAAAAPSPRMPVVALAATSDGGGYWLVSTGRATAVTGGPPRVVAQCETSGDPYFEPSEIVLACGDGNAFLNDLFWTSWTSSGALARGEYVHNTCNPDCAAGTFVSTPATVRLSYPIETAAGEEFAGLSYTISDPSAPSGQSTYSEVGPTTHG